MPSISTITPPRVPFLEAGTQWISREWYRWLLNMFARQGLTDDDIALLLAAPLPATDVPNLIDLAPACCGGIAQTLDLAPSATAVAAMIPPGCEKLMQIVADGSGATMVLEGIPSGYSNLRLVVEGRDTGNVAASEASVMFNGDVTAANYTASQYLEGQAAAAAANTIAASANGMAMLQLPGVLNNANAVGNNELMIPAYDRDRYKVAYASTGAYYGNGTPPLRIRNYTGAWLKTDAIQRITLTAGNDKFAAKSTATLYGYR